MPWKRRMGALLLLGVAFCFAIALWGGFLLQDRLDSAWAIGLPGVLLACSAVLAAHVLLSSVSLDDEGIELRTLLGTNRLALDEIRGRRQYVSRGGWEATGSLRYRLEAVSRESPMLDFEAAFDFDEHFRQWFAALPDLDALDASADEQVPPSSLVERRPFAAEHKQQT